MRTTGVLGAMGLLVGMITATVVHFLSWSVPASAAEPTDHGRYMPPQGITMSKAYDSSLSITYDSPRVHPSWLPLLPVGAGIGLAVGAFRTDRCV